MISLVRGYNIFNWISTRRQSFSVVPYVQDPDQHEVDRGEPQTERDRRNGRRGLPR
jgi:hypothetical protein